MIRKEKRAGKKYWILTVFAAFIAIAMSFVSWLIYAVFSQSYRDGSRYYECFYAAAAFVKVNINYTSKNFAVTCIY